MCFLNSQCYVKRHNIFSLTKYQLSSPHSPFDILEMGDQKLAETVDINSFNNKGFFFCIMVLELHKS